MHRRDVLALRVFQRLSQADLAALVGCSQPFVAQVERGHRPIPANLIPVLERRLAVGSPNSAEERLGYVIGFFRASGDIYVPDDNSGIPFFYDSAAAQAAAAYLRDNGFPSAIVAPVWENGLSQIAVDSTARREPVDEGGLYTRLSRSFARTRGHGLLV